MVNHMATTLIPILFIHFIIRHIYHCTHMNFLFLSLIIAEAMTNRMYAISLPVIRPMLTALLN